ncbi:glycosyltransferase family 39 protein [Patescibacteria group bacterium]|nr:glycosyltransferase family 39 protein [Patescibacteria group bacterium]
MLPHLRLFTDSRLTEKLTKFAWGACIVMAIWFLVVYCVIAFIRLRYPFELEWMEGGMVDHVVRVMQGLPLYQEPSFAFTPFIYPPLYFYVSAGIAKLTGIGFFALRFVSIFASIGNFLLLFVLAFRETRRAGVSLLAPGLFSATYVLSGSWMDIGRVDSLMLFFVLLSFLFLRTAKRWTSWVLAGLCATLAFYTKQSVWLLYVPIVIYLLFTLRKRAFIFIASGGIVTAALFFLANIHSKGWFYYYMVTLPERHEWERFMIWSFWVKDLFLPLGIGCVLIALWYRMRLSTEIMREQRAFYTSVLVGGLLIGWISRLHSGGYINVLLPTHACIALVLVLVCAHSEKSVSPLSRHKLQALVPCALLVQFAFLLYVPQAMIPSRAIRDAQEDLKIRLQAFKGPVYVQSHGWYQYQQGSPITGHHMALLDVLRSSDPVQSFEIEKEFWRAISAREFSAIVLDAEPEWKMLIELYYTLDQTIPLRPFNLVGAPARPRWVYIPKAT